MALLLIGGPNSTRRIRSPRSVGRRCLELLLRSAARPDVHEPPPPGRLGDLRRPVQRRIDGKRRRVTLERRAPLPSQLAQLVELLRIERRERRVRGRGGVGHRARVGTTLPTTKPTATDAQTGHDVEDVVVAGRHHRHRHQRAPQQREGLCARGTECRGGGDPDREGEADVQARNRGEPVVEHRGVAGQRDRRVMAHRVGHPDPGQPGRRDREQRVDRHGDDPGRDDGVAQLCVYGPRAPVQPDQRRRQDDQLRGEVDRAQQVADDRPLQRALERALDGDVRRALEIDDPLGVRAGLPALARRTATAPRHTGGTRRGTARARGARTSRGGIAPRSPEGTPSTPSAELIAAHAARARDRLGKQLTAGGERLRTQTAAVLEVRRLHVT